MIRRALIFTLTLLAPLAVIQPAHASTYELWKFRPGRICVDYHGWKFWPTKEATQRWDASAVNVVAWYDCSSQPRSMTVVIKTYSSTEYACAKTASEGGDYTWSGTYDAAGHPVYWPNKMTIWMNIHPDRRAGCYATAGQRAHVISHELGHALGLGHRDGVSVMAAWCYQWPTDSDLSNATARYTQPR